MTPDVRIRRDLQDETADGRWQQRARTPRGEHLEDLAIVRKVRRELPQDEVSRRRLAKRIVRAVTWRYRREVQRALRFIRRASLRQ